MSTNVIAAGDQVVITDAWGEGLTTEALSGVETAGHSFPVVWVARPLRNGETERAPWPAEAVRPAAHQRASSRPTTGTRAVKRSGEDGKIEYEITAPDGNVKTLSMARDYTHVRTVDRGEDSPDGRYLTTLHHSTEEAGKKHPIHGKAPVSAAPIEWVGATPAVEIKQ